MLFCCLLDIGNEIRKLIKKLFQCVKAKCVAIQNYWEHRQQWHPQVDDNHLSFRNLVNEAEALEFLVRVTHYICCVSEVIKANEKYWHFGFGFEWDFSSKFTDQLINKLQVQFDSRRHIDKFLVNSRCTSLIRHQNQLLYLNRFGTRSKRKFYQSWTKMTLKGSCWKNLLEGQSHETFC